MTPVRRVVFTGPRSVEVEDFPLPEIGGPDDVLIETRYSCISAGTELAKLTGLQPFAFPAPIGNRAVGRVVSVGSAVERVRVGDLVFSHINHASHAVGAGLVCRLPDVLDGPAAATLGMGLVAMTGLTVAPPRLRDVVVVAGLGLVGQFLAQAARLSGATVIAVEPSASRRAVAQRCGAPITVDPESESAADRVAAATDGRGARIIYDCTGNPEVVATLPALAERGATIVLVGSPRGDRTVVAAELLNPFHLWRAHGDLTLRGAHEWKLPLYSSEHIRDSMERNCRILASLAVEGALDIDALVSRTYGPEEATRAYGEVEDPNAGVLGAVFDWTDGK